MKNTDTSTPTLGFIGLGVMGASMAGHLLKAGYRVHVHNRSPDKAVPLEKQGAIVEANATGVVRQAEIIMTMPGYPQEVEKLYLGPDGLFQHSRPGQLFIDFTTSSPALAEKLYQTALKHQVDCLDAPVSGGDRGAREAQLVIMAGGDSQAYNRACALFDCLGRLHRLMGPAGAGQRTKIANQVAVAASTIGAAEALLLARQSGLDPQAVLEVISGGAAGSWSLTNLAPRMLSNDIAPGFYVKHLVKDLNIATDEMRQQGLLLPLLNQALELYRAMQQAGHGDQGTQSIFQFLESKS